MVKDMTFVEGIFKSYIQYSFIPSTFYKVKGTTTAAPQNWNAPFFFGSFQCYFKRLSNIFHHDIIHAFSFLVILF